MKLFSLPIHIPLSTCLGLILLMISPLNVIENAVGAELVDETEVVDKTEQVDESVAKSIRHHLPKGTVNHIAATPIKGFYQVELNTGELFHVTGDGKYMINGDILKIEDDATKEEFTVSNLTENYRSQKRIDLIDELDASTLITYSPKGKKKGEIYAFTDIDCGYCRQFHAEVPKMQAMGIEVHYLAWPRAGVQSKTGKSMTHIWCSKDRLSAMDQGKSGGRVKEVKENFEKCAEVVGSHRKIGERMAVRGTPAVFLKDGRQVGGYVKADQLAERMGLK